MDKKTKKKLAKTILAFFKFGVGGFLVGMILVVSASFLPQTRILDLSELPNQSNIVLDLSELPDQGEVGLPTGLPTDLIETILRMSGLFIAFGTYPIFLLVCLIRWAIRTAREPD